MTVKSALATTVERSAALLDPLQSLFALALRIWVGLQFFRSGLAKLGDWSSTLFLFQEEYHVPVLPPGVAAVLGTFGEIVFPVLLWVGLTTRLAAIGLSAVNAMAVIAYAHVLLAPGFEGAIGQHILWATMLAVLIVYGPGRLSLDAMLGRHASSRSGSTG